MRFFLVPLLAFTLTSAVSAQEDKAKPADVSTTKSEDKPTPPNEAKSEKPTPAEAAKPEKPAPAEAEKSDKPEVKKEEPSKDTKPTKENEEPSKENKSQTKEAKGKQSKAKSAPQPPEKKPLSNIGSLKHPLIPGQPWRIHDLKRPRPKMLSPGVIDAAPPADAVVLFDGENLDQWYHVGSEEEVYEAQWKVQDGYFEIEPRTGSILTIDSFGSCQLHIEWMIPKGTTGAGQGRGNSGIKFMERFEVQILDSMNNRTYADGQAAALYGQYPPLVNAVRPQGEWQTYDIVFEAPSFEAGKMKRPPIFTVIHNGVLVHHHRELTGNTGLRNSSEEVPPAAPLMLQDHGNRIRFRNIWIREL